MNNYVFKEIEKIAIPVASILGGFSTLADMKNKINENKKKVQLEPLKEQEGQLQLPGANSQQFEGGKRIDSSAITALNKY